MTRATRRLQLVCIAVMLPGAAAHAQPRVGTTGGGDGRRAASSPARMHGVIEGELGLGVGLGPHDTGHARARGDIGLRWDLGCGRSLGATAGWMVLLGTLEGTGEGGVIVGPRAWWTNRRITADAQIAYLRMNGIRSEAGHGLALGAGITGTSSLVLRLHVDVVRYPASYGTRRGVQLDGWVGVGLRYKLGWIIPAIMLLGGYAYINADNTN